MCFALNGLAVPQRAALCAARLAVGAAVTSTEADMWGVSDSLCHPPITVPGWVFGVAHAPDACRCRPAETRLTVTLRSAPPVSWGRTRVDFIDDNTPVRFSPETAFV
jgi:hypothetical protein